MSKEPSSQNAPGFDDIQRSSQDPIVPSSDPEQAADNHSTPKKASKIKHGRLSKQSLLGVCVGLLMGIILLIAIAVPIGVTKAKALGTISSTPNWVGTFKLNDACNQTQCCCLTDSLKIWKIDDSQLQFSVSVQGRCPIDRTSISKPVAMPTTFQAAVPIPGGVLRCQLGQDSSYIAFFFPFTENCFATALRTSYSSGRVIHGNGSLLALLIVTVFWFVTQ